MTAFAIRGLPRMIITIYQLLPGRRAVFGRYVRGSTSHLALAAIDRGGNGWAALWCYGRIVPGCTDGGFWGDWGT